MRDEQEFKRVKRSLSDMTIGAWENNPLDPMAPVYDAPFALKEEISRVTKGPREFREGLRSAGYHLINILTGYWYYERPTLR